MTAERTTNQHELKLLRKLLHTDQQVKTIYRRLIDRVAPIMAKYPQRPSGVVVRVTDLDKELSAAIEGFRKELTTVIESGQAWAWAAANEKTDEILSEYIEGMPVSNVVRDGIFQRNTESFTTFAARKTAGLQLSDRVWRMTNEASQMMNDYIDQALISGRSAQSLSEDVRELLVEPDKLFRRVRNPKTGKLELSKAAREYHPGRGVYRSSYKNAMRLARTEINMAYRTADQERWKRTDFVLGYEVKVSKQHWIKMPSGDICDQVAGPYPKEFVFKAWHPNCYDDQTEVYTENGWKLFKDVRLGEKCLSINKSDHDLEYADVVATISRKYRGKMIRFSNRSLDMMVTPDHPMIYIQKSGGQWAEMTADRYTKNKGAIYRSSKWTGINYQTVTIAGKTWDSKLFAEFMGYYLSDGSVSFTRGSEFNIAQSIHNDTENRARIKACVEKMELSPWEREHGIGINDKPMQNYLRQFGKSKEKWIPEEIMCATPEIIRRFLDAYVSCDGHVRPYKKFINDRGKEFAAVGFEKTYFTVSKRMADQIGELILKTGARPSFSLTKGEKQHQFKNGKYDCAPMWRISECKSETATVFNKDTVVYDGMVYDVQLDRNHTLYLRRNGKCAWGSNCNCYITPILPNKKDFLDSLVDGKPLDGRVTDMPKQFRDYVARNGERIAKYKQQPFWVQDNFKGGRIDGGIRMKDPVIEMGGNYVMEGENVYKSIGLKESLIRGESTEKAAIFDNDGNIITELIGVRNKLIIPESEIPKLKDNIFTHNHPEGTLFPVGDMRRIGNSLSWSDIYTAISGNVREMRAVTPEYTFSIIRPDKGWPDISTVKLVHSKINDETLDELTSLVRNGITTENKVNIVFYHLVNKKVFKYLNISYTKQKIKQ